MAKYHLNSEQWIPRSIGEVFAFFSDAANLERLTPAWLRFRILTPGPIGMRAGAEIEYEIRWRLFSMHWKTVIEEWEPERLFVDRQVKGPYKLWRHTHRFVAEGAGTRISDCVEFELPFGVLGRTAHALRVRRDLEGIFAFRRRAIGRILT